MKIILNARISDSITGECEPELFYAVFDTAPLSGRAERPLELLQNIAGKVSRMARTTPSLSKVELRPELYVLWFQGTPREDLRALLAKDGFAEVPSDDNNLGDLTHLAETKQIYNTRLICYRDGSMFLTGDTYDKPRDIIETSPFSPFNLS